MNAIEIKGLCKSYPEFTLDHLNLTLPGGCVMGLVGENGAGKSTTIKLILDMVQRDGGTITVLGRDNREDMRASREEIGIVLDEMGFPECMNAKQIHKMMRHTYRNWDEAQYFSYLKKLSVPLEKSFGEYSRGMKMKLGIAVALSHHPRLLILDEATSGLDPLVRDNVIEIFGEFTRSEEHSILMSSHIVSDLEKICDYIAFLHRGKLMLCEEKDRLMEEYGVIHCSAQQLAELDSKAVIGKRVSAYGVEAIVCKDRAPSGFCFSPVTVEELFIFMAKGE